MSNEQRKELARHLAKVVGVPEQKRRKKRHLESVPSEPLPGATMSALERDVTYARIRDLGNLYSLNWLIRQETMHVLGVMECLGEDELRALLQTMERGMEARLDGVAFEDVGLVRGARNNWVA